MKGSPSIARRLTLLNVTSSAMALLVAGVVLLAYDIHDFERTAITRLQGVAALLAFNSASAIDFNDAQAAAITLSSLQTRRSVMAAGIVIRGRVFASYVRQGARLPKPEVYAGGPDRLTPNYVIVTKPILSGGVPIGSLFIQADLLETRARLRQYGVILGSVFVAAVVVTSIISARLQKKISKPILRLAALAKEVSGHKDYSLRAPAVRSVAEVEQLVVTFNDMLDQIEESRATLEQRVDERTRELAVANKELEAFSYSVSHDLRAPLRAIDGFSRTLISNYAGQPLDARGLHYLERVRAGTQKMGTLIDDMLHLSRVTRSTLERRDSDITAVARTVASELDRRQPERKIQCRVEEGMIAFADPHLLSIVFDNLLGNAWKFTAQTDVAHVAVGQTDVDGNPVYFVRDNGAGFDMKYADKLFGAFQRLHDDTEFEGTGIGLATVQRIIHRHGGEIWAEAAEGKGATFYFTLGGKD